MLELPEYVCKFCGTDLDDIVAAAEANESGDFDSDQECPECGAQFTVSAVVSWDIELTFGSMES